MKKMTTNEILNSIGQFTFYDIELFDRYTTSKILAKNEVLLSQGEVCRCFYFIIKGAFFQFQSNDINDTIIDLHLMNEWMFNQESLTEQNPSNTTIQAFSKSEVIELSLFNFHELCSKSSAFLQFGKILNQTKHRASLFDSALSPADKYRFIHSNKPEWTQVFPLKMIASYLKITPETLSRVRAAY